MQNSEASININTNTNFNKRFKIFASKYGIVLILLCMILLMSILNPNFLKVRNILNILRQISVTGVIACGVTIVIITSGIDLSSGSLVALTSVVVASFAHPGKYPLFVPILVGLIVGLAVGLLNGGLICKGKIPPFIATLGTMTSARGLALLYSNGRPIGNLSSQFEFIGGGTVLGIPLLIILFILVAIISNFILNKTKFGKNAFALGGNEKAAVVCGVNINKAKMLIYGYAGLLSGLAGIMLTARISAGQPSAGLGYEFDGIIAAVVGGTSLSGGIGTIPGTVIGAMIVGVLNNGLDLMNVSSYWQQILRGAIIVIAIIIDARRNKSRG